MAKSEAEKDRMRILLTDAVTTLCRSGISFNDELKVEMLLAITIDTNDILVVNINKTYISAAVATRDLKGAETGQTGAGSGKALDTDEVSDGCSLHSKEPRKRRRSSSKEPDGDSYNSQECFFNEPSGTPSKRVRQDGPSVESATLLAETSPDVGPDVTRNVSECGDDEEHAIKIEISSDPEEDDKEQIHAQLFGSGTNNSLVAVPVDQTVLTDTMPVSMFDDCRRSTTSAVYFPSTSANPCDDAPQTSFTSPQAQGSIKINMKEYKCTFHGCEKSYTTNFCLTRHIQTAHSDVRFPCPHCDEAPNRQDLLYNHIRKAHADVAETIKCRKCTFVAPSLELLELHIRKRHGQNLF